MIDTFNEYSIIRLKETDESFTEKIPDILEICDNLLGKGLFSPGRLKKICSSENHFFYTIEREGAVLGVFYVFVDIFEKISFIRNLEQQISEDLKKNLKGRYVGMLQSIALNKEIEKIGISDRLLSSGTAMMFDNFDIEAVLTPAWIKKGYVPAYRLFVDGGYVVEQELHEPWSFDEELECQFCNQKPCSCNGLLFVKWRV